MVQSAELLLDDTSADAVRAEWRLLSEEGLPSQADHRGPTNAPHVTVGVADEVDDAAEKALESVPLPGELRLGGLLVFTSPRRVVLARSVVVTPALLATHAAVADAWAHCPGQPDHLAPGRWTPARHPRAAPRPGPARPGRAGARDDAARARRPGERAAPMGRRRPSRLGRPRVVLGVEVGEVEHEPVPHVTPVEPFQRLTHL